MKGIKTIVAIGFIVLCLIGWGMFASQKVSESNEYKKRIEQADAWIEDGLYQRAIKNYMLVLEEKKTEEIYEKTVDAYALRFHEKPEETIEEYLDFLEDALMEYPANAKLVETYVELSKIEYSYKDIYECVVNAIEEKCELENIHELRREAQYAFQLKRNEFSGAVQTFDKNYIVERNGKWNIYNLEEGFLLEEEYSYIGPVNEEGVTVIVGEDSRMIDGDGMVMAIFEDTIEKAGMYAEGKIAACSNGVYSYYDEFGNKLFGDYEMAGMFQEGQAAVKKDGKWMLIDKDGKVVSELYEEIVLDLSGRYLINDRILASLESGTYCLYDEKWKKEAEIKCEDVDFLTEDEVFAVCKDGKWGFANMDGEMVIDPMYDHARSFSNGVAAVCKDGKWGCIDSENYVVIDYTFTDIGYMTEAGSCFVRVDTQETAEDTGELWKILKLIVGMKEEL